MMSLAPGSRFPLLCRQLEIARAVAEDSSVASVVAAKPNTVVAAAVAEVVAA